MLKVSEICKAVGGKLYGNGDTVIKSVCIDSRKCETGQLFIALTGGNFDGNQFAGAAMEGGCSAALVSRDIGIKDGSAYIKVDNTGEALISLAAYYRQKFNIKIIGITGSVGKTTTKEMVYNAIASELLTHKTQGNYNNEIGLPLTLLGLRNAHQAAVVEMGMSAFGEISLLSKISKPDIAIITNIGMSHIETLKTMKNILKAKLEILDGMEKGSTLILNGDDNYLKNQKPDGFNVLYYGVENNKCDVNAQIIDDKTITVLGQKINMPISGTHNISNAAAAMAASYACGISLSSAARGIESYKPDGVRQTLTTTKNGVCIMSDYYNASPKSVAAALDVLKSAKCGRRIAVLGDMLELGEYTEAAHREIGEAAAAADVLYLITVGEAAKYIANGALSFGMDKNYIYSFDNNETAADFLSEILEPGDMVLIKGSRGMKMEQIYKKIYDTEGNG